MLPLVLKFSVTFLRLILGFKIFLYFLLHSDPLTLGFFCKCKYMKIHMYRISERHFSKMMTYCVHEPHASVSTWNDDMISIWSFNRSWPVLCLFAFQLECNQVINN